MMTDRRLCWQLVSLSVLFFGIVHCGENAEITDQPADRYDQQSTSTGDRYVLTGGRLEEVDKPTDYRLTGHLKPLPDAKEPESSSSQYELDAALTPCEQQKCESSSSNPSLPTNVKTSDQKKKRHEAVHE